MSDEIKKRGRPRKDKVVDNNKVLSDESEVLLMSQKSATTLNDVKQSLFNAYTDTFKNGNLAALASIVQFNQYNPFLQNNRLKTLNSYPSNYAPDEINEALKDPQNKEMLLRGASASLSASQYLYYKILREACDIPLFKHYAIPPVLKKDEYLSKKFQDDEEFVDKWIDVLHIETLFKKISMEVKREGKPTYLFRQCISDKTGKKEPSYVMFQKLPPAYTKLTGIGNNGYIASLNLLMFLQPAYSPLQYPKYIQDIWEQLTQSDAFKTNKNGEIKYNLNVLRDFSWTVDGQTQKGILEIDNAVKNNYMYWVQLPQDLCFTFASDMSNAWAAPDTMGMFTSLQELTDYSTLAGLITSSPLTAVLTGQTEFVDGAQPGQDQTRISPHTLESFTNMFNDMVSGNINAFFGPFKDMRLQALPNIPNSSDIKTKAVQNFLTSAGEGGLIAATDKPSVASIKGSQLAAESQYDFVVRQIENVVNLVLNKYCDLNYEWQIKLWGGIYTIDSQTKNLKELVSSGATFLLPKLASAYDLSMRKLRGLTEYIDAYDIYSKFKTLGFAQVQQNAEQQTNVGTGAGRTSIEDNDIENDNTAASKENGGNISELKADYSATVCDICGEDLTDDEIGICHKCREDYGIQGDDLNG